MKIETAKNETEREIESIFINEEGKLNKDGFEIADRDLKSTQKPT